MRPERPGGFVGRFLGSWELAVGELFIVALGVLIALWADQAIQARNDAERAIGYLEGLQTDLRADINALRFSSTQAQNRLALIRRVDGWLKDPSASPDPDTLVMNAHYAGVTFFPTISRFTIEELKSTGDLRLIENQALKREVADYYNQVDLQIDQWIGTSDRGNIDTYFRELAFVIAPELRIRAGTIEPGDLQAFMNSTIEPSSGSIVETKDATVEIGATPEDAGRILEQMRSRPNFAGYLRDGMYWAHLSNQLMEGVIISAQKLDEAVSRELQALRR